MPEFFLELFSEEIPARMQARAADDLRRLVAEALDPLAPANPRIWFGPRRIALALDVAAATQATTISERGPRTTAPEQALAGFLRKHGAAREELRQEGDFWVLARGVRPQPAANVITARLPNVLWKFPWPKSMRWGSGPERIFYPVLGDTGIAGASAIPEVFKWVRPLRRIVALVDGTIVPFSVSEDTHNTKLPNLVASNLTEGHRFHAPGAFEVSSAADWQQGLRDRRVIADAAERRALIEAGIAALAAGENLTIVNDPGLLDEVAGLVEYPVPLLGRIDDRFMDLPPEVMQVSMRVNQRYFALRHQNGRDADGQPAARFAFVANIDAADGGAAIISGNERVLRARFSDARHFWDLDRRSSLEDRVPALDGVTFHARLGSQGARARRLVALAGFIAGQLGADAAAAARAALLAKADLTTGMVGEFPELQGVMGGYYASHDGENPAVARAIAQQYQPRGPGDAVPSDPVAIALGLADRIDQLAGFFSIGEKPTGSGDPYALRRAALGVIRLILDNRLHMELRGLLGLAAEQFDPPADPDELLGFIVERLRVQLRAEGKRHDVLAAILADSADDDLTRLIARTEAVASFLAAEAGANLLAGYRRAANILRIEDRKDGPHEGMPHPPDFQEPAETALWEAYQQARATIVARWRVEDYTAAMDAMAALRAPLDTFFAEVTVNDPEPKLRRNRLLLLRAVRDTMNLVADFSRIEG